jgi:hypothetical protein
MATVTASYNWVSGETVTPTKLNTTAAPTVVVADNEVTTAKILDANVTTAKIADANVTAAKLASNAVETAKINSGAVTGPKLADGMVVQTVYAQKDTSQYIDTVFPQDNTKPQNTEGEEVITASITPSSNTNKVLVEALLNGTQENGGTGTITVALFKDSDASAIATTQHSFTAGYGGQIHLFFQDSPATASSVTYKIRAGYGAGGGGFFINQFSSGAAYDGTMISCLKLTEIKAS